MNPKIVGSKKCELEAKKLLIAAEIIGVKVDYTETDKKKTTFITSDGVEIDYLSGLRYLARLRPDIALYGRTLTETASVDCALTNVHEYIMTPLSALTTHTTDDCKTKLVEMIKYSINNCIQHLTLDNTFLMGERLSIADIDLALTLNCILNEGLTSLDDAPAVQRWMDLIMNQPVVKKHVSNKVVTKTQNKESSKPSPQKSKKEQPQSAADIEDQIAAEEKAKAKKENPLDTLPPTALVLDEWKREYSNCKDLKGVAMPWFWQHYDKDGWSLWYMKYEKLEGENTIGYATANMLGGFLQRLEQGFRKYSFSVINVVGETGNFDIQGVWMIRGHEIPFELTDHPSFEYYSFKKMDPNNSEDKKLIEDYWCNEESVEGRPIDSCKVWK